MPDPVLHYRAGPRAFERIRARGFRLDDVRVLVGPASGPKWLVLAGIDRALLRAGLAAPSSGAPRLLVGASAGAWRMLALASPDPETAHRRLLDGYVGRSFPRGVRAPEVSAAYRAMLRELFDDATARRIVDRRDLDVAIHTTRVRGPWPWDRRAVQLSAFALAAALHGLTPRGTDLLFHRVLLHTRPERLASRFDGEVVPLTAGNLRAAALASGSVPLYMEPVRGLAGAPRGAYLDGGLADYHVRQAYGAAGAGLTLLPHFQERIAAVWFDRYFRRRRPAPEALADVVAIHPSRAFVASLPEGRLPDRDDFFRDVDRPGERIRRWREVASRSERLGEALAADLASGSVPDRIRPL